MNHYSDNAINRGEGPTQNIYQDCEIVANCGTIRTSDLVPSVVTDCTFRDGGVACRHRVDIFDSEFRGSSQLQRDGIEDISVFDTGFHDDSSVTAGRRVGRTRLVRCRFMPGPDRTARYFMNPVTDDTSLLDCESTSPDSTTMNAHFRADATNSAQGLDIRSHRFSGRTFYAYVEIGSSNPRVTLIDVERPAGEALVNGSSTGLEITGEIVK